MHRNHIRFFAALAAVALLALGVAGTASAKKKLKPLKPDSVLSINIKDGEVNTNDLAGAAVTATQLAAQSVSTSALADDAVIGGKVQDDSLTGDDVNEDSLKFGCGVVFHQVPGQIHGTGPCVFVANGQNATWRQAADFCRHISPAAGLPSSDELLEAVEGADDQNPLRDVAAGYTNGLLGGSNPAPVMTFSNGNFVNSTSGAMNLQLSSIVCTYPPAGHNG